MPRASPNDAPHEQTPLLKASEPAQHLDEEAHSKSRTESLTPNTPIIVMCLFLGSFLFAIDGVLVTTLAPAISSDLGKAQLAPSLGTTYLAGACAVSSLYGRTSDIYGRRALLVFAGVTFTIATALCGICRSIEELLFWRTIAGVGGSGLMAMSSVVLGDLISNRRRGIFQGASNLVFAAGSSLGGPLGGIINDSVGWRSAFLYQLPLCVVVTTLYAWQVRIPLPEYDGTLTRRQRLKQVDFYGSACIIISIFCLVGGLQLGGNFFEWNAAPVLILLISGVVGLGLFLVIEAKVAKQPVVAIDVLCTRTVAFASLANLFQATVIFATIFQLPVYFLILKGLSPSDAGWHYLPMSASLAVGSLITGQVISKSGNYTVALHLSNIIGCITPALIALTWSDAWNKNDLRYFLEICPLGFGNGGNVASLIVAVVSSVDHARMATAMSIFSFTRALGQVLGVSLSSAVVQESVRAKLLNALADRPDKMDIVDHIRTNIQAIRSLPPDVRDIALDAYREALKLLFWIVFGCTIVAFLLCLPIPQHELSQKKPMHRDEDAE